MSAPHADRDHSEQPVAGPLCARCGQPALGFATINGVRYCHADERSCYTQQCHENPTHARMKAGLDAFKAKRTATPSTPPPGPDPTQVVWPPAQRRDAERGTSRSVPVRATVAQVEAVMRVNLAGLLLPLWAARLIADAVVAAGEDADESGQVWTDMNEAVNEATDRAQAAEAEVERLTGALTNARAKAADNIADRERMLRDIMAERDALLGRLGPCICNYGPGADGPEEWCPQHGRPISDWESYMTKVAEENISLRATVARVEALADELEAVAPSFASKVRAALSAPEPAPPTPETPHTAAGDAGSVSGQSGTGEALGGAEGGLWDTRTTSSGAFPDAKRHDPLKGARRSDR